MPTFLYANNAKSTLSSGIDNVATSIVLQTGDGSLFPSPAADERFAITLTDSSGNREICYCTARSGDTLTIVRGQEGTSARSWASGDGVGLRVTKGIMEAIPQIDTGMTANTVPYASDTNDLASSAVTKTELELLSGSKQKLTDIALYTQVFSF